MNLRYFEKNGEMRRLYGYLIRRGFQGSDISHVLEELEIKFSRNFLKNSNKS